MPNSKRMLSGIGINLSVRNLAKFMAGQGVIVNPYVGRQRGYITMPGKAYGIDLDAMSETGSSFYSERVSQGHLCFIPREDEAELSKLEQRLRRAVDNCSIAGGFVPIDAYMRLKEEFNSIQEEYFKKRDEVLAKWSQLQTKFEDGAREMLNGINIQETMRAQLMKEFLAAAPTEASYRDSFVMELKTTAFQSELNTADLDPRIAADAKKSWAETVVSTALISIEMLICEGWELAGKAMRQYLNSTSFRAKTMTALINFRNELAWKNVFKNQMLAEMQSILQSLETDSTDSQAEAIELALTNIFGYAGEVGVNLDLSLVPYSQMELEQMLALKRQVAV